MGRAMCGHLIRIPVSPTRISQVGKKKRSRHSQQKLSLSTPRAAIGRRGCALEYVEFFQHRQKAARRHLHSTLKVGNPRWPSVAAWRERIRSPPTESISTPFPAHRNFLQQQCRRHLSRRRRGFRRATWKRAFSGTRPSIRLPSKISRMLATGCRRRLPRSRGRTTRATP